MKRGRKSVWNTKIEPRLEQIKGWCRNGYTDEQICKALGVHKTSFYKYKAEKTELSDALKTTKEIADLTVENSLYMRAIGCTVTETTIETIVDADGNELSIQKKKTVIKELPPDARACEYWSNNRQPKKWRNRNSVEMTGADGAPLDFVFNVIKPDTKNS